jgi:uncharacterized membrane protein YhaH (DUF805 family)
MNYMFMPLKRYADFSGRSRRLEFWLWWLFNMIVVGLLCTIIAIAIFGATAELAHRAAGGEFANYVPPEGSAGGSVELNGEKYAVPPELVAQAIMGSLGIPALLLGLWWLATLIPNLAVAVRRMHDQDKSGWWILIGLVPLIGGIWLLILYFIDGTPGPNRFGQDPKGRGIGAAAFA